MMFRSPTVWEQYRAYILAVIAAILIQVRADLLAVL
jgi:hypothetical protein